MIVWLQFRSCWFVMVHLRWDTLRSRMRSAVKLRWSSWTFTSRSPSRRKPKGHKWAALFIQALQLRIFIANTIRFNTSKDDCNLVNDSSNINHTQPQPPQPPHNEGEGTTHLFRGEWGGRRAEKFNWCSLKCWRTRTFCVCAVCSIYAQRPWGLSKVLRHVSLTVRLFCWIGRFHIFAFLRCAWRDSSHQRSVTRTAPGEELIKTQRCTRLPRLQLRLTR